MNDSAYSTGWLGPPKEQDELTNHILIVLNFAGKTISYKDAALQIDEIMKSNLGGKDVFCNK